MATPSPELTPKFLTVREAANLLRITDITLYRLIGQGFVPSVKVGARRLVPSAFFADIEANALAGAKARVPAAWADADIAVEEPAASRT